MKYTISRTETGFELLAQCESEDPLFQGEFGLTGRLTLTEPRDAVGAVYQAARDVLVRANPTMEKKRRSQT